MTENKPGEFPQRIYTVENGTKENEGVFISWEEAQAMVRAAREEGFKEGSKQHIAYNRSKVFLHGTDGCLNCETGRITIFAESGWCPECREKIR